MQRIQILPEALCNKIAAGEVVERPASVIKELVENSLDAGASEILVEVEGGGKRLMRVTDNGRGMSRDDAFLALERHATSKIRFEEDLFRLTTLGFRGEALPSIASVCRLLLRTREAEALAGWEIYAEGGVIRRAGEAGAPPGTSLEVRNLFFNTPVRRKFLRRDETELGHIADVVTKQALAYPKVRFFLSHNGRPLLELPPEAGLRERVGALLGRQILADLVPLRREEGGGLCLHGLIGQPAVNRATAANIFTFINGRYIRDRVVQHAVMEGYRSLLMKGRYPVAVLFLEIDPARVDVNVHPTKHEVRFRDQGQVHDFIAAAVREALAPARWLGAPGTGEVPAAPAAVPETTEPGPAPENRAASYQERIRDALTRYGLSGRPAPLPAPASAPAKERAVQPSSPSEQVEEVEEARGFFSGLRVIGQYRHSYIVCQDGDDLLLVDQHAAHERVRFEKLRAEHMAGRIESQSLLFPEVLELDFRAAAVFSEHLEDLGQLGFEIEPFGSHAFALKAVPGLLADADARSLVRDVAAELAAQGKSGLVAEAMDRLLMVMACHGAVRANRPLLPEEVQALFTALDGVDFKAHCPHGRPVMVRLMLAEVERMFKRTG